MKQCPDGPVALGVLQANRKSGKERLHDDGKDLGCDLLSFWQWSVSDLVSNATRGVLAEYIVARALGIPVDTKVRNEWSAYDLKTPDGVTVQVKSAAYIQSWAQKQLSTSASTSSRAEAGTRRAACKRRCSAMRMFTFLQSGP